MHKSMTVDPYHLQRSFRDDLTDFQAQEQRKREDKQRYYQEAMQLEEARQQKKRLDRHLDLSIAHIKQHENEEQQAKRADYFSQWRQKHFTEKHPEAVRLLDEINYRKEVEQQELQNLIAVKGGMELNQRVAAMRLAQVEEKAAQKEKLAKDLKGQVEENTYKAAIDRYLELSYERNKMQEMVHAPLFRARP